MNRALRDKWMQGAVKHPGELRSELRVAPGKNIPEAKLEKATHSKDPLLKKRAVLVETFKKFRK